MLETKSKIADIIYSQLILHNPMTIAPLAYGLTLWMNRTGKDVSTQILSLAATLICMLQKYGLSHIDVLSTAENIVFSDRYNNIQPAFKKIMDTIEEI